VIRTLLAKLAWPVRVLWLVAALLPNNLTDTMSAHSQVLRTTMSVELWLLWALVALATWLHHPISLTTARCIVPVVVAHLLVGLPDSSFGVGNVIGAACALVALVLIYTSDYGSIHVQAGAYGDQSSFNGTECDYIVPRTFIVSCTLPTGDVISLQNWVWVR
jgi:hypothetical protein